MSFKLYESVRGQKREGGRKLAKIYESRKNSSGRTKLSSRAVQKLRNIPRPAI